MREDNYLDKIGKYRNAKFTCYMDKKPFSTPYDEAGFDILKEALKDIGIDMSCKGRQLSMEMNPEVFLSVTTRLAGPKPKNIKTPSRKDNKGFTVYYSDILSMMQTMSDKEIMEELRIPKATFYRHKKAMMSSIYYQELDKARLDDFDYLKSAMFDEKF